MRPVSRGNLRRSLVCGATCQKTPILWSSLHKNPCPDTSSKATLWMKSQHEGALTTPCIIWKNPQVPHTARQVACHLVNNLGGKQRSIPPHSTSPESPVPTQQGRCNRCLKWRETVRFLPPLEMRPPSISPNPVESREVFPNSTVSLTSQRHPENLPEVTGTSRGNSGILAKTRERS